MEQDRDYKVSLKDGVGVIRAAVKTLPARPGVYRMLDARGRVLYVGKAKALSKRVVSYARIESLPDRLRRMVALTRAMEFVHTETEVEALMLEASLIKSLKPVYNIVLRDDKSFASIAIDHTHDFPLMTKHRGAKRKHVSYYGPYANAYDVNRTMIALQRAFQLRNCADSVFAQRTRPCLQYHIKRCTAPCVGLVSKAEYAEQVLQAQKFLEGKNRAVQDRLVQEMQTASANMDYERAAACRDRIQALTSIQSGQKLPLEAVEEADLFALSQRNGKSCVQVFFIRAGRSTGNCPYFPQHGADETAGAVMSAFLSQFYAQREPAREILVNIQPEERALLEEAFSERCARNVKIQCPVRGRQKKIIAFVEANAREALDRHIIERTADSRMLEAVGDVFGLEEPPARIEIFDNSHISGANMVGAMVVAGPEGFNKKAYRRFNIKAAQAGDDYGMMREVLERRFRRSRMQEGTEDDGTEWPDLILVDGGQGQLNAAVQVLEDAGLSDRIKVAAIAKGPDRNAGRERFFMPGRKAFELPRGGPVLMYLQRLRDEAHRFVIGGHRAQRVKKIGESLLDEISGIGPARKKALLHHFGSARAVAAAGYDDLRRVEGVSGAVAKKIHDHFQGG